MEINKEYQIGLSYVYVDNVCENYFFYMYI